MLPGVGGGWWYPRVAAWCRRCPRVAAWWLVVSVVAGGILVVLPGGWWCPRGAPWCRRCPRGAAWWLVVSVVAGGILVLLPGGWWCPRSHIHSRTPKRVHARLLSVAALSLVKRSCRARLMDMIALIINYLGAPLGITFIGW